MSHTCRLPLSRRSCSTHAQRLHWDKWASLSTSYGNSATVLWPSEMTSVKSTPTVPLLPLANQLSKWNSTMWDELSSVLAGSSKAMGSVRLINITTDLWLCLYPVDL
ncbi:hypothetical protein RRG08_009796 [Elysia crispata]|uniref:Uncharacterized protein n=1 Tax=Elysia crispata TaxID=231223 RepID=A0AAE1DK98_9GAST|nr:hypothetical protein RRG08_009796 [Elysia crispata]